MNRRSALKTMFGQQNSAPAAAEAAPRPVNVGLEPFSGSWTKEQAAHLLRRTMYGPNFQQINQAADAGLEATLDLLFADTGLPDPPVNYFFEDDPNVPVGETWVDAVYINGVNLTGYRNQSLYVWFTDQVIKEQVSIREKMLLFWHNHFVVSDIGDPKFLYVYLSTLRQYSLGNFREFVKAITVDPAMLRYLNGNQNTKNAPNENYARELLELFTIGKGPLAGPGDYTNYTEGDILEIAKVLTGWIDRAYFTIDPAFSVESKYLNGRHDQTVKTLSERFNNASIAPNGEDEYKDLIDIIFDQDEVSRFICRKLYRYFVYYLIDEDIETNVIEPMAQILRDNDYEIEPALRALLSSEHFYHELNKGVMIRNPLDFLAGATKSLGLNITDEFYPRFRMLRLYWFILEPLQMLPFFLPSVAGWPAYYQEPSYHRIWINSVTLPIRQQVTDAIAFTGFVQEGVLNDIDPLGLIGALSNPYDPNVLIQDLALVLFPNGVTDNQVAFLKEILIYGLPDFEWTTEYAEHIANPDDVALMNSVSQKVRGLLRAMMNLSEFYLS